MWLELSPQPGAASARRAAGGIAATRSAVMSAYLPVSRATTGAKASR
jgi:hypothetical protein